MKWILSIIMVLCSVTLAFTQNDNTDYQYHVDLNKVVDDKFTVTLNPPKISSKTIKFQLPKIIPGTYAIYDFGRFVTNFQAIDKRGKKLKVSHIGDNTWTIKKAHKLAKIVYTVEDTWDTKKDNKIFEPAGTNIEVERNFVLNNHGFFGFFEGMERENFYLTVDRPSSFYGATAMKRVGGDEDTDIFLSKTYNEFVDHPMMFCKPDTAMVQVGNAEVLIANYSPTNKISAKALKKEIAPILQAQKEYLGGKLPVDRYAFIIYLTDGFSASGGYGALEHNFSSFYVLPEAEGDWIMQTVRDVAAHEFFHIVTPLNIHSEEIHYFDFIEPKMSQHLWMYEGITEYSAGHVQVKHGLMSVESYMDVLGEKVRGAEQYKDDLPFTELSLGCLKKHENQYMNVYNKGALIGMCLDLKLINLTNGKYNLQRLMRDLAREYGQEKPFKDDALFDEIGRLSHPDIVPFLETYVAGPTSLPLQKLLATAGVEYAESKMVKQVTLGGLEKSIGLDPGTSKFYLQNIDGLDAFGKTLGFKEGDIIEKWNGKMLNLETINPVLGTFVTTAKAGDPLSIIVTRANKEVELAGEVGTMEVEMKHFFNLVEKPTSEQMKVRKTWIGDYKTEADLSGE